MLLQILLDSWWLSAVTFIAIAQKIRRQFTARQSDEQKELRTSKFSHSNKHGKRGLSKICTHTQANPGAKRNCRASFFPVWNLLARQAEKLRLRAGGQCEHSYSIVKPEFGKVGTNPMPFHSAQQTMVSPQTMHEKDSAATHTGYHTEQTDQTETSLWLSKA